VLSAVRQHVGRRYIDGHAENLRRLPSKSDEVEQRPLRIELNKKINVAVRTLVLPSNRSENPDIVRSVILRGVEQSIASLTQTLEMRCVHGLDDTPT